MPLPVTKGELNRLGARLIAGDNIYDPDREELATVLGAYQEVLDRVKTQLRGLGFSATGRVKTTGTLTDKLRRSHGMQLSRMQDLAGARIVVSDLRTQDQAVETIQKAWEDQGCPCKIVDRRETPSFGYRAVHAIVQIDAMPVEIQIRTELQDVWAQIVERLGDRWGRGIRYGEDPENPQAMVRSGELVNSRLEIMDRLMQLSESCASIEIARQTAIRVAEKHSVLKAQLEYVRSVSEHVPDVEQKLARKLPPELAPVREGLIEIVTGYDELVDQVLLDAGADMTGAQAVHLLEISHDVLGREMRELGEQLQADEHRLRDILQMMADATDEGE